MPRTRTHTDPLYVAAHELSARHPLPPARCVCGRPAVGWSLVCAGDGYGLARLCEACAVANAQEAGDRVRAWVKANEASEEG